MMASALGRMLKKAGTERVLSGHTGRMRALVAAAVVGCAAAGATYRLLRNR